MVLVTPPPRRENRDPSLYTEITVNIAATIKFDSFLLYTDSAFRSSTQKTLLEKLLPLKTGEIKF